MVQNCNPLVVAKRSITEYAGSRGVNLEDILQDESVATPGEGVFRKYVGYVRGSVTLAVHGI
jgi:hypothetical protein